MRKYKLIQGYEKKKFLYPNKPIIIEIFIGKANILGLQIVEINNKKFKTPLTPLYFYPFSRIKQALFFEIKDNRLLTPREVSKLLIYIDDLIDQISENFLKIIKIRNPSQRKRQKKDFFDELAKKENVQIQNLEIIRINYEV